MPSSRPSAVLNDSKKGYTLKEKYDILQYIIKQNAYNEVRGRSFWLTMERAKITPRTWQSLKEVFLKRILPDLRNPYYKLTQEQIRAFSSRSVSLSNAAKSTNWVEKNKVMDKVLNRSMSEQNEETSSSPSKRKNNDENEQGNQENSPRKTSSPKNSSSSELEWIPSSDDASDKKTENRSSAPNNNTFSQLNSVRVTRNRDKENSLNVLSSQDSQPIESFPTNALLTSTPRKSLLRSSNLNSAQKNTPVKNNSSPPKIDSKSKTKTPIKVPSKSPGENNAESDTDEDIVNKKSPQVPRRGDFSPKILMLSSYDSSLSEDSSKKTGNKSKKNLFGFSSGKPNVSGSQAVQISSETDFSSELPPSDIVKPSTSNYISPSRPSKLVNRQKSFQGASSDSDDEDGNSSDSQYTYYRNSDSESLKRKGKKMYGLFRGKLVPLYEPKKKCCVEKKELTAKGGIVKKRKIHKGRGAVYIDNDFEPKNALNGRSNEKGENMLSKEILNFWKLKYLSLKRRNDEIMRLLAKQKNETYIDSVTKMLTDPINIPDKIHNQQSGSNNNLPSLTQGNINDLPAKQLTEKLKLTNPGNVKQPVKGKMFFFKSAKSQNEPSTSKTPSDSDNVVVIDSQKADIIIDILKKVSEMNKAIDPIKVNSLIKSPGTKSIMPPSKTNTPSKTRASIKQTEKKLDNSVSNKTPKEKEIISDEILKLREKEERIFEKIRSGKETSDSNTKRDIFSTSELELLFDEKDDSKNSNKNRQKRDKSEDSKEPKNPPKKLRSNNKKVEPDKPPEPKQGVSTSNNTKSNNSPSDAVKSNKPNSQTIKKAQPTSTEKLTEDSSNVLPESMDIEDSVKFAINPKFFSILFPDESKYSKTDKKNNSEIISSSDKEFDESARYALPKSSSFHLKKHKNRRSTGKVIKLKMFTNIKKDKRQSFHENEDNIGNNEGSLWLIENNFKKSNLNANTSDSSSDESAEIPLQKFTVDNNNLVIYEKNLCINNLCRNTNQHSNIDLEKPLLEQSLEDIKKDNMCINACPFCKVSPQNFIPESLESVPLLSLSPERRTELTNKSEQPNEKAQSDLVPICSRVNQNDTVFVSFRTQEKLKSQQIIPKSSDNVNEESTNMNLWKSLLTPDLDSTLETDISGTSLFETMIQSHSSPEMSKKTSEIIKIQTTDDKECDETRDIMCEQDIVTKQMIKDLMTEDEDSDTLSQK